MLLVEHRANTLDHLARVPTDRGVEIDVRDYDGDLRLVHDPLETGERLEDWLAGYRHALLIFNVKCDGLEDYFFLDVANPTLVSLVRRGERRVAVRYSEYEPIEFALAFAGQAEWCWIDCFTRLPLNPDTHARLRQHFKLCLVSPELQKHPRSRIAEFRRQLAALPVDAVCTDYCEDWL
jgi:hypothetical protein